MGPMVLLEWTFMGNGQHSKRFDKARAVCREAAGTAETKGTAQRAGSAVTVAAVERLARSDRRHAATVDNGMRTLGC